MADLVKLVLEHLEKYFRILINLAASPRLGPNRLGLFDQKRFGDAVAFFGISAVVAFVVKIPADMLRQSYFFVPLL